MFDYKEDFLQLVQRCVKDLHEAKGSRAIDPLNLLKDLADDMLALRTQFIHEAIDIEPRIVFAYKCLDRLLDYHQPHHIKEPWFGELRGMVAEHRAETMQHLEAYKKLTG